MRYFKLKFFLFFFNIKASEFYSILSNRFFIFQYRTIQTLSYFVKALIVQFLNYLRFMFFYFFRRSLKIKHRSVLFHSVPTRCHPIIYKLQFRYSSNMLTSLFIIQSSPHYFSPFLEKIQKLIIGF